MHWKKARFDPIVRRVLLEWHRTPYCPGSAVKQVGVDCVRFVAAFLNEMDGVVREPLKNLPRDIAFHRPATARSALRQFLRIYQPHHLVFHDSEDVEAGDVGVVQPGAASGPGHAIVISADAGYVYHATSGGVVRQPWTEVGRIIAVYRSEVKSRWSLPK